MKPQSLQNFCLVISEKGRGHLKQMYDCFESSAKKIIAIRIWFSAWLFSEDSNP